MIKKLSLIAAVSVFTILFFPKINLFYLLEDKLYEQNIIISQERYHDKVFSLRVDNAYISYDKIQAAKVAQSDFALFIFFNQISLDRILIDNKLKEFFPYDIKQIKFTYHIFDPLHIQINSTGDFGELKGKINIQTKIMKLILDPEKDIKQNQLLSMMKLEDGKYRYEYKF